MTTLYVVVPCYNEEEVLPETSRRLGEKLDALEAAGRISKDSRVLFVDDGSSFPGCIRRTTGSAGLSSPETGGTRTPCWLGL